jgi:hypothetical protein
MMGAFSYEMPKPLDK